MMKTESEERDKIKKALQNAAKRIARKAGYSCHAAFDAGDTLEKDKGEKYRFGMKVRKIYEETMKGKGNWLLVSDFGDPRDKEARSHRILALLFTAEVL